MATNTSRDGKQVRQSQWLFLDAADTAINVGLLCVNCAFAKHHN